MQPNDAAPARDEAGVQPDDAALARHVANEGVEVAPAAAVEAARENELSRGSQGRGRRLALTRPEQYCVQFTAGEEHARLIERAKALTARKRPGTTLGELHLQAMRLLVAHLERPKGAPG